MNLKSLLIAVIGACIGVVALEAYHRYGAASDGTVSRAELSRLIHEYIVANPEVLQEAMAELEKRQTAADSEKARDAIKRNAELLFNSKRQVVAGNKQGDVTLVEFFDYNCPYCKQANVDLDNLMKSDGKLRVVFKEFPVLGPASVEAAQVAVAVRMQDPSGEKYLAFRQALLANRGQSDKVRALAVAGQVGADVARIEADMNSDEVKATLEESFKLAEQLGLNGTPSYVIGSEVAVGALGLTTLQDKVRTARCAGAATC